ncbi:4'-phosphopantetheinyl transferase superfamily protein [Pleomorphomonas sp. JP5]|uniref:4'-phosphopantetheinyl transferase family protein n=1 Tax=Pleomorphomonas sp. JP5 TaxID=2942998 RepID=UPI002043A903|nr:4'-phosphopantetheinyl transferase superfamily protein [Pleomorphomonas sp. JP5]MCM5558983.1 4'-phosphopantetheinyl transferase superfamily protein [Pleomorphomonas sp. JP5]
MEAAVTVWHIPLSQKPTADDHALLDATERRRAERFLREEDRQRYVRAHAAMRRILAQASGWRPDELVFVTGEYGKPALAGGSPCFNLSHSGDHAVLATSFEAEIGIDIEARATDTLRIAKLVLAEGEMEAFLAQPADARDAAFLRAWTRKEALLKALGCGLVLDPRSVEVGLGNEPSTPELAGQKWTLRDFALVPGLQPSPFSFTRPDRNTASSPHEPGVLDWQLGASGWPQSILVGSLAANKKISPVDIRSGAIG